MAGTLSEREFSRRSFLKAGGATVVGVAVAGSMLGAGRSAASGEALAAGAFPLAVHPSLDDWIAIHPDGTVTLSVEKSDIGTHSQTGLLQIAAEELDVAFDRMRIQSGDTSLTPDLGTSSSSAGITTGGPPVRAAAATARQALVGMAARKLGVERTQLMVNDGVVSVIGDPSRKMSYAELMGGRQFGITMLPHQVVTAGYAGTVAVYGTTKLKDPSEYTIVGTSVPKLGIREKVTGEHVYVNDVRVPGMVHARGVRPPTTGASLVRVDKASIKHIPGIVDVVVKGDYVAVVAETEWAAIQAAGELKTRWSDWRGGVRLGQPSRANLYAAMRTVPSIDHAKDIRGAVPYPAENTGNVEKALRSAAKVVTATYESPYHVHGPIGPPAVVADVTEDRATVYSSSQNIYGMRAIVATLLGLPERNVRFIAYSGASAFGDSNTDDCAAEACLISQAVGRPVRLQYMRNDDHKWDSGHSARVTDIRAGLDAGGKVIAYDLETWSSDDGGRPYGDSYAAHGLFSDYEYPNPRSGPSKTAGLGNKGTSLLPAVLMGPWPEYDVEGIASASVGDSNYSFPNTRWVLHYLGKGSPRALPLNGQPHAAPAGSLRIRTSSESGVGSISAMFAGESFMDELAAAARADPIAFRQQYLSPAHVEFLDQLANRAGWQARPSPNPEANTAGAVTRGRGMAVSISTGPGGMTNDFGEVFEVEVNRKTGLVTVTRVTAVITAGLIINPDSVTQQVEGNTILGISQALVEERTFNERKVTSVDWVTYPILRFGQVPQEIDVLVINSLHQPPGIASELNGIPAPALGNAIYDATGVRIRTLPYTAENVYAALKKAGKAM